MWSIVLVVVALVGLTALFSFKALELSRSIKTPLSPLSQKCDPIIQNGWKKWGEEVKLQGETLMQRSRQLSRQGVRFLYQSLLASLYELIVRLHEYLSRRRGLTIHPKEKASLHLKTMLEYKQEQKQADAQPPADR